MIQEKASGLFLEGPAWWKGLVFFEKVGPSAMRGVRSEAHVLRTDKFLFASRGCRRANSARLFRGLSGAERQEAGEWLGRQLMSQKSTVLSAFLRHTIEKDGELLRNMPPCSREGEGDGRIAKRREELSRRIRLAERVLEMMET